MFEKNKVCYAPFYLLRVEQDGNCYSCSSAYVKDSYCFGNIFTDDIDDIWNGEKAKLFRKDKLNCEYSFCKRNICNLFASDMCSYFKKPETKEENDSLSCCLDSYPLYVSLSYDFSCSEKCVFCRDKTYILEPDIASEWESILYTKIIPLLKHAKILEMTCAGELLISKHSQKMLKEIVHYCPDIKLKLFSNGIYCTEEKFSELGILENIEEVCISLHCVKKDTYKKIFRNENFDKVISNIKYIASLKQKGLVKNFCLQFVITRDNYKEIKEFIKFANSVNAIPVFTFVIKNDETEYCKNYYNYSVHEKEHYLYNSFVSVLQDPFVQKNIPEHLKKYQKISQLLIIKNWFRYIMNKRKEV